MAAKSSRAAKAPARKPKAKARRTKQPRGRPSSFSEAIAARICERLAQGESLRAICADEDMPNRSTVSDWLAARDDFADQYARAREAQADTFVEQMFEIADDATNDYVQRKIASGEYVPMVDHEHVNRSKLRVDTRKWAAARLAPKKYGDKLDLNLSGSVEIRQLSDEDLDARIAAIAERLGVPAPAPLAQDDSDGGGAEA